MNQIPEHKEFASTIRDVCRRHHLWRVFADFCEMAALSLANAVPHVQRDAFEKRYLEIVRTYSQDEAHQLAKLLAITVEALEDENDFLGEMFMQLELASHWHGQFFTPYAVSRAIAAVTAADVAEHVSRAGLVTVLEPAVGSGGMVLALADELRSQKINYQQAMHVTAIDVSATAAHMAFIQLSLRYVPARVYIGNTLAMEMRQVFETPAHVLGFWDAKLKRHEECLTKPESINLDKLRQGDLFDHEEAA